MTGRLVELLDGKYNDTRTENNMPTHSSSGSWVLDLFFKMGASRTMGIPELQGMFKRAWNEDAFLTLKAMFYNRDIRGGQGERRSFRIFLTWLANTQPEVVKKNLHLIPEYGRWDDLFVLLDTDLREHVSGFIWKNLSENKLLCKWMPRENKAQAKLAKYFMMVYGLTARNYRKLLAGNTEVVETQMCKNRWGDIKYPSVPSVAMNRYRKAFMKRDFDRFIAYVGDVKKGVAKINASAIFPHDIVKKVWSYLWEGRASSYGDHIYRILYSLAGISQEERDAIQVQWDALPNYLSEGKKILPVCDVSGSMEGDPLQICVSLGIYLAERNKGLFENAFITFSGEPKLQVLNGKDLAEKVANLASAEWQTNTNIEKVFTLILDKAVSANLPEAEMPDTILILSDMQFDQGVERGSYGSNVMQLIRRKYEQAHYRVPDIVYWNLRSSIGSPVKFNESGTALVSGFSPSIMTQILGGITSPLEMMKRTLLAPRYEPVTL